MGRFVGLNVIVEDDGVWLVNMAAAHIPTASFGTGVTYF
jgi:hypothetical protein